MAKRSPKPRDTNSLAASIVAQATDPDDHGVDPDEGKDPAAVAGGRKGGEARAEALTPERRSEIAKQAAAARWSSRS